MVAVLQYVEQEPENEVAWLEMVSVVTVRSTKQSTAVLRLPLHVSVHILSQSKVLNILDYN